MGSDPQMLDDNDIERETGGNPLSDDLANMPSVNAHVIDAENADSAEQSKAQEGSTTSRSGEDDTLVDYKGRSFDPSIHKVDDSGNPVTGERNRLQIKPKDTRGKSRSKPNAQSERKQPPKIVIPNADGSLESVDAPGSPAAQATLAINPCDPAQAAASAQVCMQLVTTLGKMIDSDEWEPKPDERQNLTSAFTNYFMVRGSPDIPPEVLVIATVGAYAVPRLQLPRTSDKIARIKESVVRRFRAARASAVLDNAELRE